MESGHLSLQEGVLEFQPCGEGTGSAVEDASGQDVRRIIRELDSSGSRITALVLREGNRLLGIRYAGLEGPGCADLPPPGLLEARGNEPFWLLRIDREGGRVTSPEEPDGVPHREGRWFARSEGDWTYEAEAAEGAQPHRVHLRIREERCVDSMSGARYPFTVTLEWGKRRMNGCALEGREAIRR